MGTPAEKLNYLNETKKQIKQAIIDKGVDVTNDDTFRSYATKIGEIKSGGEIPDYMSAKNFTFDGNACTGYVGDNTLPEIIIPQSYSTVTSIETFVGAKVLNKNKIGYIIRDFISATFSDGENNTHVYSSRMELYRLENDFPNDCYLVSMEGSYPLSFDFLEMASDMQILQFPIVVNGQSFSDGRAAFDYITQNDITDVNFGGDVEVTKVVDGNDYQVTSVSGSNNSSGFKNYQNRIILLSNLTSIGNSAFYDCNSLTSIEIPNSVTSIGELAFQSCISLTSVSLPSTLTSIADRAFFYCSSLASITLPSTLTSIGELAFQSCISLTSITIPEGVTAIGGGVFSSCSSLEAFNGDGNSYYKIVDNGRALLVDGGKTLSAYAIGNTATSYTIPVGVTSIGRSAFQSCSNLTEITIPDSVTSISAFAFWGCSSLTSITIPEGVTEISGSAFQSCRSLTTMRVEATTPPTLSNTNAISTATTQIQVPMASVEAYKTATNWSNFADIIVGY